MRFIIFVVLLVSEAGAASWYVDNTATGLNNGTSWVNAWQNPTNVVWASVSSGDTVYISGGPTGSSQTYTNDFTPTSGKSGTFGNNITQSIGQDASHNGKAIFLNCHIGPSSTSKFWTLNGGRDPNFVNPTNHVQVISGTTCITNNCGIWVKDLVSTNGLQDTDPVGWLFSVSPKDLTFRYVEVSGMSNALCGAGCDWKGTVFYVNGNSTVSSNVVLEFMYLHDNTSQQFSANGVTDSSFDTTIFRYGMIISGGEDHFEVGSGWSIHDSVIGPVNGYGKSHTDFFQLTGNYIKIYNNDIRESANSIVRIQTFPDGGVGLRHDIWFFNNLVTEKVGRAVNGGTKTEPFTWVHFDPIHPASIITLSNNIVANNLFYNSITNNVSTPTLALNPAMNFVKGAVTDGYLTSNLFVNNLWVDKHKGVNFPATTVSAGTNGYVVYTTNDVRWIYNVHASDPIKTWLTTPRNVSYLDISTNLEAHAYQQNNLTNYPSWVDRDNDNFELALNDTSSLNNGMDMSAYFNFDTLNRPRNVGGAWDRGPLEAQSSMYSPIDGVISGLLAFFSFEENYTNNYIADLSGSGNNAYRYGRPGSPYPDNFPSQVLSSATGGVNPSTYSGDFIWHTNNDYGLYNRDGDYGAITNVSAFTNLSQCSIMVRARYQTVKRIDASYDYSQDGNSLLVSAGTATGVLGAWDFGRFNQSIWLNNTRFLLVTNSNFGLPQQGNGSDLVFGNSGKVIFNFPDNGFSNGNTTNFHHYAVTFSSGLIKAYFDGIALSTNDVSASGVTKMTVGWNNSVSVATAFIGIGCDTHGGTPALDDEVGVDYPNNGFFNGTMDDVRIYNRVLSDTEILDIASGIPLSSGGGSSYANLLSASGTARIGTVGTP